MKKIVAGFFVVLAFGLLASLNHAASEQLMVDHFLTGYSKGTATVTVYYTLHVVNPGGTSFSNLALHMVPLPPLVSKGTVVQIGKLGPHERKDVTLNLVAPAVLDPQQFSRNGLFWTGKYIDVDGKTVEFPLMSRPLAAK